MCVCTCNHDRSWWIYTSFGWAKFPSLKSTSTFGMFMSHWYGGGLQKTSALEGFKSWMINDDHFWLVRIVMSKWRIAFRVEKCPGWGWEPLHGCQIFSVPQRVEKPPEKRRPKHRCGGLAIGDFLFFFWMLALGGKMWRQWQWEGVEKAWVLVGFRWRDTVSFD